MHYVKENDDGDRIDGGAVMSGGKMVTSTKLLHPTTRDGETEVSFTFDASALQGGNVVVFETLYERTDTTITTLEKTESDKPVTTHSDPESEEQSVHYPEIGTKLRDGESKKQISLAREKMVLIDTVSYENLDTKKRWKLEAVLMDKATGEAALDDAGQPIKATKEFKPKTKDGTVEVKFTFNGKNCAGKTLVAFEKLYLAGTLYAEHEDLKDAEQTVTVPKILTSAYEAKTGSHTAGDGSEVTVKDLVKYSNLTPGNYTVKGTLMSNKTGKVIQSGGKNVTAEASFTAKKPDGSVLLTFTFDASALGGDTVVAFEELYLENVLVAEHRDLNDAEQSVSIVKIDTNAHFKGTDSRKAAASAKMTVVDRVTLEGLTVGEQYTLKGRLMDQETGKELVVNGKTVTAEKAFTAKASGGYVDIEFSFDGSKLSGKKAVVFEKLFYAGVELTKHEDLKAKNQIVTIAKPEEIQPTVLPTATPAAGNPAATPSTNPSATTETTKSTEKPATQNVATAPVKTGDTAAPFLWTALVLLSAMLVVAAWRRKYRK
ncbi:MAG: VaFE repeat-containing surface-anchored protein [Lachnospiraceae bacterium]|nr:VaFE repeat-containing surface-anchored protein [Lachnospiraceae bacterium]